MERAEKRRFLQQATIQLIDKELEADNKDDFTRSYFRKRLAELRAFDAGDQIARAHLQSASNLVSSIGHSIRQTSPLNLHGNW